MFPRINNIARPIGQRVEPSSNTQNLETVSDILRGPVRTRRRAEMKDFDIPACRCSRNVGEWFPNRQRCQEWAA